MDNYGSFPTKAGQFLLTITQHIPMKTITREVRTATKHPAGRLRTVCATRLLSLLLLALPAVVQAQYNRTINGLPAQNAVVSEPAQTVYGAGHDAAPILLDQIGAAAQKQYSGDGLSVAATEDGAMLRCVFQRMNVRVTAEGLWITSTVDSAKGEPFRVMAHAVGRSNRKVLPCSGTVEVADNLVRFVRPGLTEEYSVSMDGVRQDLVVTERPAGAGQLRVELAVEGAKAEQLAEGARLVLADGERKIVYNRLRAVDARGKELTAKLEVLEANRLAVVLDDTAAEYPVRIDPTFSDDNWGSIGGVSGANGAVRAMVLDGSGNLYIGGDFTMVGNVNASGVAKWDGSSWSALGDYAPGASALAVVGTNLYAGGSFISAGTVWATNIAKWNGSSWSAVGGGRLTAVTALAVSGSDLYVGYGGIAKWDGSSWSYLGSGVNGQVFALAVSGSNVYAGGTFTTAGGVSAKSIAKWDGSSWSALGSGMGGGSYFPWVFALAVSGSNVYAGGSFMSAGGNIANQIARWNGSSWSPLGSGMGGGTYTPYVRALAVSGSDLYVGGEFTTAGGTPANHIAKWDGSSWSALGSGLDNDVYAVAVAGSDLYVGGYFATAGGSASTYVAEAQLLGRLTFTTNNGTITITGYNGSGGMVFIPKTISGLPVTSIESWAFTFCTSLTNIIIPNSVTNIGDYTFNTCPTLTEITVDSNNPAYSSADGVLLNKSQTTLIQFPGGKAGSYTIPNSVTNIGDYAFCYCTSLTSVTIGNSVTSIGGWAFYSCTSLTGATIPNSVTSIGDGAFADCTNLTTITIPNSVTSVGDALFSRCTSLTNATIPNTVTSIGGWAFYSCTGLTSATIPNSVTEIGDGAFYSCTGLTNVTIGKNVTNIGDEAFASCSSLTAIEVDSLNPTYSSVVGILFNKSTNTLIQCPGGKAGSYIVPNNVTSIANSAFAACDSLTNITIGTSVTNIGDFAFASCDNLTAITVDSINSTYSSVAGVLFDKSTNTLIQCPGGKTGSYIIPSTVTSIGDYAFDSCTGLTNVTIPNSVTNVGNGAFGSCYNLTSVTIGNGVTNIEGFTFYYCTSLTSVTIPSSVTSIGDYAFYNCTNFMGVYFQGNAPSANSFVFYYDNNTTVYYLPGTTGWDTTFGDRPTALWYLPNPLILNNSPSFGVRTNRFGFIISWATNVPVAVEACTNLANHTWAPVGTNTLTGGWSYFSDPKWTNYPCRFYRVRSP